MIRRTLTAPAKTLWRLLKGLLWLNAALARRRLDRASSSAAASPVDASASLLDRVADYAPEVRLAAADEAQPVVGETPVWEIPANDPRQLWRVMRERRASGEPRHHLWQTIEERRAQQAGETAEKPAVAGHSQRLRGLLPARLAGTNGRILIPIALAVGLLVAAGAFAYFTSTGTGTGAANAGSLTVPQSPTATASGGTVTVAWNASTLTDGLVAAQSYTVERYSATGADLGAACGGATIQSSSGNPNAFGSFQCVDSPGVAATYEYKITATYNSWVATSGFSTQATTAFGTATKIALTGSTSNLASGSTRTVTAQIEDAAGNPVTSGPDATDALMFSATSGPGTVTGLSGGSSTVAGQATVVVTGNVAGNVTLQASGMVNGNATNSNTNTFTVIAGPATQFVLTNVSGGVLGTQTAETAFSVKVTALDQNGNTATSYAGSKTLSWSAPNSPNSTSPTFPSSATSVTFTSGVGTATGIVLVDAQSPTTLGVEDANTTSITGSAQFTVSAATATSISASSGSPQTADIDSNFPSPLAAIVNDVYGNPVSGASVTFTAPTGSSDPVVGTPAFHNSGSTMGTAAAGSLSSVASSSDGEVIFLNTDSDATPNAPTSSQSAVSLLSGSTYQHAGSGSMAIYSGSPPQTSETLTIGNNNLWGTIAVETSASSASQAASGSAGGGTSEASSSFTVSAGSSYLVFASTHSSTGDTLTPSGSFSGTNPTFTQIGSTQTFDSGAGYDAAWYVNGGTGTGTITITFAKTTSQAYLEVVQLPVAGGSFASGCHSNPSANECVALTNASGIATSSTLTANSDTGSYSVSASASGAGSTSFSLTNILGASTIDSYSSDTGASSYSTGSLTTATTSGDADLILVEVVKDGSADTISSITGSSITGATQVSSVNYVQGMQNFTLFAWKATGAGGTGQLTLSLGSAANDIIVSVVQLAAGEAVTSGQTNSGTSGDAVGLLTTPNTAAPEILLVGQGMAFSTWTPPSLFGQLQSLQDTGADMPHEATLEDSWAASAVASATAVPSTTATSWGAIALQLSNPVPTVTGVSPTAGSTGGSQTITVNGTNLTGATAVTFGTTAVTTGISVNGGGTQLTVTSPSHAAGTVDVTVTTPYGVSTTSSADKFTFGAPVVTGVAPTSGSTAGGTTVTISGSGFTNATAVKFGTTSVTSNNWTINNDGSITATAPAGTGTVDITVSDAVGPSSTSSADVFTYIAPATVMSVGATTASGYYDASKTIAVTVTFNQNVTVNTTGGTPTITLNTTPSETASYASGSGSATLTFDYTVQSGDTSSQLDYSSTSALTLNGGTIQSSAINASLTLPTPAGGSDGLHAQDIIIDTTPPSIAITKINGSTETFPYTTNQNISSIGGTCGTATGDLTPITVTYNSTPTNPTTATCSGGTWTLALTTQITSANTYSIVASQSDQAGNTGTNMESVVIDKTPPTLTSINIAGSSPASSGPLTWTVAFSKPVNGVTTSNFALATSGTGGTAPSITSAIASGGAPSATWTVTVSTTGTTGTSSTRIGLNLANNTGVTDIAGNTLTTTTFTGQTYTYNTSSTPFGATDLGNNDANPCGSLTSNACVGPSVTTTNGRAELILINLKGSNSTSTTVSSISGPFTGASQISGGASVEYPPGTGDYLFAWTATGNGATGSVTVTFNSGTTSANPIAVDVVQLAAGNTVLNCSSCGNSGTSTTATASLSPQNVSDTEVSFFGAAGNSSFTAPTGFEPLAASANGNGGGFSTASFATCPSTVQSSAASTLSGSAGWGALGIEIQATASPCASYAATGAATTWSSSYAAQNVAFPSGTAAGDLLLLVVIGNQEPGPPSLPGGSGWNAGDMGANPTKGAGNPHTAVYWKVATASDVSTGGISVTPNNGGSSAAWVIDYKAIGTPAVATSSACAGPGADPGVCAYGTTAVSSLTPTTTTTNAAGATEIQIVMIPAANTLSFTSQQSFTLRVATTATTGDAIGVADESVASSGTTPTAPTWSLGGTTTYAYISMAFT